MPKPPQALEFESENDMTAEAHIRQFRKQRQITVVNLFRVELVKVY